MQIRNKKFTSDWRKQGVLVKPVAEHTGLLCVVCTKAVKATKVEAYDKEGVKLWSLPFRSGNPDDVFQASKKADEYPKPFYLHVTRKTPKGTVMVWRFLVKNPLKRSDGKSGPGNF